MAPGWTELALMPSLAYWIAVDLASRWTAALEALYAADHDCPTSPAPEDMLMMEPTPSRPCLRAGPGRKPRQPCFRSAPSRGWMSHHINIIAANDGTQK